MSRFGARLVNMPRANRFGARLVEEDSQQIPHAQGVGGTAALIGDTTAPPARPSAVAAFGRELPGVFSDVVQAALGPARGPVSNSGDAAGYEAAKGALADTLSPFTDPEKAVQFQKNLAKTAGGQVALRAEQGLSNVAEAGLSLASRAFGGGKLSAALHADKEKRDQFLTDAEAGGDLEGALGKTGSRILNGVVNSVAKFGAAGLAGPTAVYSLMAGETFDNGMAEAKSKGLDGNHSLAFAGGKAIVETAITAMMGKIGGKLGLESFEESLSPAMRQATEKLAAKAVPPTMLTKFAKAMGGAGMESLEEGLVDIVQQGIEVKAGTSKKVDLRRSFEAAVAGAVSRGATGAVNGIKEITGAIRAIPADKLHQTLLGVQAAESATKPKVEGAPALNPLVEHARQFFTTATEDQKAAAGKYLNQAEFAELTGIKKTSQTFRDSFASTVALYQKVPKLAESAASVPPGSEAAPVADPAGPGGEAAQTPAPAPDAVQAAPEGVPTSEQAFRNPDAPTGPVEAPVPVEPGTSAKRSSMSRDRELLGLPELPDAESRSWATALDTAMQNGTPGRALDLANEVIAKPRAFSDVETAGVVVRAAELKNQFEALDKQLSSATEWVDVKQRSAELNRIEQEFDTILTALRRSGTEKGRALAAQKLTINKSYDLLSSIARAKATKGAPLSESDRAAMKVKTDAHQVAEAAVNNFEAKAAEEGKQKTHREVARLRGAVGAIRRTLGLDPALSAEAVAIPGLTEGDKASLAKLSTKLAEAEANLDKVPIEAQPAGSKVHNRPSEQAVSDLDDGVARVLADLKRRVKQSDSSKIEQQKIDVLQKRMIEAQETLRKARAGEPTAADNKAADVMSEERDRLHYELKKTRQQIRDEIVRHRPKNVWDHAATYTDLSRGMITGMDYSAVGRQAKFAAWAHPIIAVKALPAMFKAGMSDFNAYRAEQEILSRPLAPMYELGMTIHRKDAELSQREENFASKVLEKVPLAAGSQRAYVAFINQMRADTFDYLAKVHGGDIGLSQQQYKDLGHLINVNTGRGGFAAADQHMRTASLALFAPRFLLSRIQYAIGEPAWRSDSKTRSIVAQEYARTFMGAAAWYGLYAAAWGDDPRFSITFDPHSTDFGKIVLGNTRIDPMAGLAQVTRFAVRMLSGQSVDKTGKTKTLSPDDKWREASRFARSKMSPILGDMANLGTGADVMGNPVNVSSPEGALNFGLGLVLPLSIRDIGSAMEDQGIPRGTAVSVLNMFGEGLQVYGDDKK